MSLTLWCSGLELEAPESLQVGEEVQLSFAGIAESGLLIINTDFHTEVVRLPPGSEQHTFSLEHVGLLQVTLQSGAGREELSRTISSSQAASTSRLEINPKSEVVGSGRVQVISWSWDDDFNPTPPTSSLLVRFPDEQKNFEQSFLSLVATCFVGTTKNVGVAEVELGEEVASFRQVPATPKAFLLTRNGDVVRTTTLVDDFGNILQDGTVATWTLFRDGQLFSTAQTSVLNGLISVPVEVESSEVKLKIEVLGQSAWIDLTGED